MWNRYARNWWEGGSMGQAEQVMEGLVSEKAKSPKWQAYLEFVQGGDPSLGGLPICPYAKGGKYFIADDTDLVVLTGAGTYAELRGLCEAVNPKLRPFGWFVLPGAPDSDFNINGVYTNRTPEP